VLYRLLRTLSRLWLAIFNRLAISGSGQIPSHGPAILCANHSSYFDSMVVALCTPRPVRFLIFRDFYRHPLLGFFVRACGAIPVNQLGMDREALAAARQALEEGGLIAIFPEGRLSRAGLISRPQHGAAHLALLSGAPLVPISIHGAYHVYRRGWRLPRPGAITVRIGSPLVVTAPSTASQRLDRQELTARLMTAIRRGLRVVRRKRQRQ
jgi:1-acyl-sn-glycerol-3-phosphate acyltransferase